MGSAVPNINIKFPLTPSSGTETRPVVEDTPGLAQTHQVPRVAYVQWDPVHDPLIVRSPEWSSFHEDRPGVYRKSRYRIGSRFDIVVCLTFATFDQAQRRPNAAPTKRISGAGGPRPSICPILDLTCVVRKRGTRLRDHERCRSYVTREWAVGSVRCATVLPGM